MAKITVTKTYSLSKVVEIPDGMTEEQWVTKIGEIVDEPDPIFSANSDGIRMTVEENGELVYEADV